MKLMDALAFCRGFPRRAFPQVPRRNYYRGPAFGTSANTTADRIDTAFLLPVLFPTPFHPTFRTLYLSFSLHAFTSFFPSLSSFPLDARLRAHFRFYYQVAGVFAVRNSKGYIARRKRHSQRCRLFHAEEILQRPGTLSRTLGVVVYRTNCARDFPRSATVSSSFRRNLEDSFGSWHLTPTIRSIDARYNVAIKSSALYYY